VKVGNRQAPHAPLPTEQLTETPPKKVGFLRFNPAFLKFFALQSLVLLGVFSPPCKLTQPGEETDSLRPTSKLTTLVVLEYSQSSEMPM
jgi:hypothetical protein